MVEGGHSAIELFIRRLLHLAHERSQLTEFPIGKRGTRPIRDRVDDVVAGVRLDKADVLLQKFPVTHATSNEQLVSQP
jgi:hypothetical protein